MVAAWLSVLRPDERSYEQDIQGSRARGLPPLVSFSAHKINI